MITVKYIGEADYGCEEYAEGAEEMCLVVIEQDGDLVRLEISGQHVDSLGLKEKENLSEEQFRQVCKKAAKMLS